MRGGRRKRSIDRFTAPVWCPGGRWGGRRVRTSECEMQIRSETVYIELLKQAAQGQQLGPGSRGTVTYQWNGRELVANWEVLANSVWRFGRVFFRCSRCRRLCTRLYVPLENLDFGCRRCWGLSYASQTLQNYKNTLWGRSQFAKMFMTTQRDWSFSMTCERRERRAEAAAERWNKRKKYLKKAERLRVGTR